MLTTTVRDKFVGPVSFGAGDEVMTWRRMTIELQDPYYVIEYQLKEGRILMGETVIVYFLDDLINICKQANEDPRLLILAVQLLSPKRINQTNNWKLEELREVWRYSDDMDDQITFVTTGGERRNWGRQTMAKDFSKTAKLIWEMPT